MEAEITMKRANHIFYNKSFYINLLLLTSYEGAEPQSEAFERRYTSEDLDKVNIETGMKMANEAKNKYYEIKI